MTDVRESLYRCVACSSLVSAEYPVEETCDSCGTDFKVYPPAPVEEQDVNSSGPSPASSLTCSRAACEGPIVDGRCAHCFTDVPPWPSLRLPWQRDTLFSIEPGTDVVFSRTSGPFVDKLRNWPNVSAPHCVLTLVDSRLFVSDTGRGSGSLNGTYVNDERLLPNDPHELKPGDELRLGRDSHAKALDSVRVEVLG